MADKRPAVEAFVALVPRRGKRELRYLIVMPQITKIKEQYYVFPVGIAYISSALKAADRNVSTLNLNYKSDYFGAIKSAVDLYDPDVVLTGGLTAQYTEIKRIIDYIKSMKPEIITVIGGGLITSDPLNAMAALETADFGVIGEGEITVCRLAACLEDGRSPNDIAGIVYRDNECNFVANRARTDIPNLDILPWPDYEGLEFEAVIDKTPSDVYASSAGLGRFCTINFGRSCPYNCTFCFHPSGTKYRQRSLDSVFAEIHWLVEKYDIQSIAVTDELFAANKSYIIDFCERIKPYGLGWTVSMRVDGIEENIVKLMKDAGCVTITLGIESADNRILKSMQKNITIEQTEMAIDILTKCKMHFEGGFIFGDSEETFETAMNTVNWWKAHSEYMFRLNWIIVYPGSVLFDRALASGVISDPVQYIKNGCPIVNVSKMTDKERQNLSIILAGLEGKHAELSDVTIKSGIFGRVNISGCCPECGSKQIWSGLDMFRPFSSSRCINCGAILPIYACDYLDYSDVELNVQSLLKRGKIAVWPVFEQMGILFRKTGLGESNTFAIDSSPLKHGLCICGKRVNPPNIMSIENIKTVILTLTTPTLKEIVDTIQEEYPNVDTILLGELVTGGIYTNV